MFDDANNFLLLCFLLNICVYSRPFNYELFLNSKLFTISVVCGELSRSSSFLPVVLLFLDNKCMLDSFELPAFRRFVLLVQIV